MVMGQARWRLYSLWIMKTSSKVMASGSEYRSMTKWVLILQPDVTPLRTVSESPWLFPVSTLSTLSWTFKVHIMLSQPSLPGSVVTLPMPCTLSCATTLGEEYKQRIIHYFAKCMQNSAIFVLFWCLWYGEGESSVCEHDTNQQKSATKL